MGLNIKNEEVERLAAEAAKRFGETKTQAIRVALKERLAKSTVAFDPEERYQRLKKTLETEIWPKIPPENLGRPVTREEEDEILGYGPDGV